MKGKLEQVIQYLTKVCDTYGIPYHIDRSSSSVDVVWNGTSIVICGHLSHDDNVLLDSVLVTGCHEIAHWMVATPERRHYSDFGLCADESLRQQHHLSKKESISEENLAIARTVSLVATSGLSKPKIFFRPVQP